MNCGTRIIFFLSCSKSHEDEPEKSLFNQCLCFDVTHIHPDNLFSDAMMILHDGNVLLTEQKKFFVSKSDSFAARLAALRALSPLPRGSVLPLWQHAGSIGEPSESKENEAKERRGRRRDHATLFSPLPPSLPGIPCLSASAIFCELRGACGTAHWKPEPT